MPFLTAVAAISLKKFAILDLSFQFLLHFAADLGSFLISLSVLRRSSFISVSLSARL